MRSLEDRFKNAKAEYHFLKESCEAQVVQWRWASWDRIEPVPFYFKRNRFFKGSWLKQSPERLGGGVYQYGFDQENRLIVARQPLNWPDKINYYEEFFQYDGHVIYTTYYDYFDAKEPINVTRKTFEGARFAQFECFTKHGIQREIYHYKANQLLQIEIWQTQDSELVPWSKENFTYDTLGRLDRIEQIGANGGQYRLYRRPQKGETMKNLSSSIQRQYVDIILKVIAAAGIQDRVYCLALVYDLGNDPLPALLALGTDAERKTWMETYGGGTLEVSSWIWSAGGDFIHYNKPELAVEPYLDAQLIDSCDLFNQQYHLIGSEEPVINLMNNIAAELMQLDWHDKLNITDDFVVYAVDFESYYLERNMAASIPSSILSKLREKGYF